MESACGSRKIVDGCHWRDEAAADVKIIANRKELIALCVADDKERQVPRCASLQCTYGFKQLLTMSVVDMLELQG